MHILLIEDNTDLVINLCEFFEQRGHTVDSAGDGLTGLHLAVVNDYDVIVLDLMLPGMDGIDVCRQLRGPAARSTPLLMLTARDTLDEKLVGFAAGADDYLIKPFALSELEARLCALATRPPLSNHQQVLEVGDLTFNLETLHVERGGVPLKPTRVGLRILELLMRETHRVVRRREVERLLWGDDPPDSDALRSHIHALRKIMDRPFPVPLLRTVHGIGYRLAPPDAE